MAEWIKCEYRKGEIDRAGKRLIPWWINTRDPTDEDIRSFFPVDNWRTCHGLPLNVFQAVLRGRAKKIESGVVIAQRLKRFPSLMNKLVRETNMKLSQMQDLGGCRAVLSSVSAVNALWDTYQDSQPMLDSFGVKCYDYINNPKDDGYRGIHVVGRYYARIDSRKPWNGQRIEIQLRSRLQHAFATAVETVTTFTQEPLKFGAGPIEWRYFFSLMGSALALREDTPLVKGTPTNVDDLIEELRESSRSLNVHKRLRGWTQALKLLRRQNTRRFKWLLLVLDLKESTMRVMGYNNRKKASKDLAELEKSKRKDIDAVLVWVPMAKDLRAAYPNYYADTREFLSALDTALSGEF